MADGIFGNPAAAEAKARQAAGAAEHYRYLLTWVEGAIDEAIGAAGHDLVAGSYRALREAATGQLERLRTHGAAGATNLGTCAVIVADTDAANTSLLGTAAAGFPAAVLPVGGQR